MNSQWASGRRTSARLAFLVSGMLAAALFCFVSPALAVERFGDVVIAPQALANGDTFHGYREHRVLLENHSLKDTREVTLIFPDRAYGYGDSISRISRTVSLAPASSAVVSLWQPPLPIMGNNTYRVIIGQFPGESAACDVVWRALCRPRTSFRRARKPQLELR